MYEVRLSASIRKKSQAYEYGMNGVRQIREIKTTPVLLIKLS